MKRDPLAVTLIELLVCLGIIALLVAIILPSIEKARHRAYVTACASNLRQIGVALQVYAQGNHGQYPRTTYVADAVPAPGTGASSPDPFAASSMVKPNDTSSPLWLLARVNKLPTALFICPYNDENEFNPDPADTQLTSNFSNFKKSLGYSYANPYPSASVSALGYRLTTRLPADFPLAADLNPGKSFRTDPTIIMAGVTGKALLRGNSINHELEGQNVLYNDGHVTYSRTPLCGRHGDNIYTTQMNQIEASPANLDDAVLLPDEDD